MDEVFNEIKKSVFHGQSSVLVRITQTEGSSPGKTGACMLVCQNGRLFGTIGGGDLEKFCSEEAEKLFETKESYSRKFLLDSSENDDVSMICGGNVTVEFMYIGPDADVDEIGKNIGINTEKPRALIFGGGHVGKALCPVLTEIGFEVTIFDDRSEFASLQMHPTAKNCILCDYNTIFDNISIKKSDYIIIMTHGHIADREVLLQACRTNAFYIGCIGSRKKIEITKQFLRENDIPNERISSVCSPIGLPIGGNSPQEIAISIAAQLIQYRYGKNL